MNKGRNFRRRTQETEDENDEKNRSPVVPPKPITKPSRKPKTTSTLLSFSSQDQHDTAIGVAKPRHNNSTTVIKPKQNLLSFELDEGGDARSQRAPLPHRQQQHRPHHHVISKERDKKDDATVSNVKAQAGEYTKERLDELRRNTKSLGVGAPKYLPSEDRATNDAPVVVLKGMLKPSQVEQQEEKEEEEEEEKDDVVIGNTIPDKATIDAIRAKRERMRQAHSAPDYIPIDAPAFASGSAALAESPAADDDSSDDEAEIRGRIAMLGGNTSDGRKGVFESKEEDDVVAVAGEMVDDGSEADDEEKRWEEEQFRKGFGKRTVDDASISALPPTTCITPSYSAPHPPPATAAAPVQAMSLFQQAQVATNSLKESLLRLQENHGRTQADLHRADQNLSASLTSISLLEKNLEVAGEKYIYMQKLRDFISVLCDFLQDKAPYIEELEEQMQRLHEERATTITERRAADDAEEMAEVEVAAKAAMGALNKGLSVETASATAAAAVAVREGANLAPQLDEFGRDMRGDLKRKAEARKQRRDRVVLNKSSLFQSNGTSTQSIEGESSSDESDSDYNAYQSSRNELLQIAENVFSDASEEFSKLSLVKGKIEGWKNLYSSAYRDAYMPLSAPAIFSPFVRLEILKWDPLYEDSDFNSMQWHTLLFDYGMPENGGDFDPEDADADLVPALVEKVALPVLHHELAHCWDRFSTRTTRNAVSAVHVILNYVSASSNPLQELLATTRMRLAEAVVELQVPSWTLPVMNAVSEAARIAAYKFGMAVRLLKNIGLWKDVLALQVLEQLALDELLCRKMLPHLRNIAQNIHDAVTRTERVIAAMSGVWIGASQSREPSLKLLPLVEYIMALGKELEKKQALGVSKEDTVGLARRLKKMLVELNEYDKARYILKTFQLKEAL